MELHSAQFFFIKAGLLHITDFILCETLLFLFLPGPTKTNLQLQFIGAALRAGEGRDLLDNNARPETEIFTKHLGQLSSPPPYYYLVNNPLPPRSSSVSIFNASFLKV